MLQPLALLRISAARRYSDVYSMTSFYMFINSYNRFDKRQRVGLLMVCVGAIGALYCLFKGPGDLNLVGDATKWIFGTTLFAVLLFAGGMGVIHYRLDGYHLKILDLIWISASTVAVVLAAVQATQLSAGPFRAVIKRNIEVSKSVAIFRTAIAYQKGCVQAPELTRQQCESLRRLNIALSVGGYLSPQIVETICPKPINLDAPPSHFSSDLIEGCINAGYVAAAPNDPVMIDEANVTTWRSYASMWSYFLAVLIALRVAKSIGEVCWRIK
ncbi:hypothetical protein K2O51_12520 [Cupriavidus pinatubonensis]|uniref:hypothetical protein n=1 Tax=Cupriavidus pinatubonensis TaxID=248026 RepID=UPI001C73D495|nr:hypothetical protein [Cupriavidus pinatubonensis]QYY31653.1 hypothetical protein K2O51_12520 [Cupriavidus pinatubonensis]